MKTLLVLAGATAALAAVPAAASACTCAVTHHKAHYSKPVHYAKPVRRTHYSRVVVERAPVRTVYVTRVVRVPEPYPVREYAPAPPPPGPDMVVYRHHWRHHGPIYHGPIYGGPVYPRPDAEFAYPHDGWRADVNRY